MSSRCVLKFAPSPRWHGVIHEGVMIASTFFTASLLALVYGKPTPPLNPVVHDRRAAAPAGFVHSGAALADNTLTLRINLVQNDMAGLESALNAASFPDSPLYGQWLSKEEVSSFRDMSIIFLMKNRTLRLRHSPDPPNRPLLP